MESGVFVPLVIPDFPVGFRPSNALYKPAERSNAGTPNFIGGSLFRAMA
jgi:hypothetical protein